MSDRDRQPAQICFGIDLGGTKTEIAALAPDGSERLRHRIPTPKDDYPGTVSAIAGLVRWAEAELGETGSVGIGIPGAVSHKTGLIKNANSTWLIGKPLQSDLEAALDRPVRLANDADCFVLSEATDGAGTGHGTVWGVILGTGCGSGIAIDGRLLAGPNAIAGEWGHNPLPWPTDGEQPGPPCYCGKKGCIETFVSGPGLRDDYRAATSEDLDAETIAGRAAAGEAAARSALDRHAERLARATASVINILDPDIVILGGGIGRMEHLYDALPALWPRFVFSDRVDTHLATPRHGDSSGVRGAARLWDTL